MYEIVEKLEPYMLVFKEEKKEEKEKEKVIERKPVKVKVIEKEPVKEPPFAVPEEDKLFWIFFIIKHGFARYQYPNTTSFVNEKLAKFECIEHLRTCKDKLKECKVRKIKENIEDDLANKPIISVLTFFALCLVEPVNVIFIQGKKYYQIQNDEASPEHHIIYYKSKYKAHYLTDVPDKHVENLFKCEDLNVDKTLRAISYYKVADLLDICKKVSLDVSACKKKDEIYSAIVSFLL